MKSGKPRKAPKVPIPPKNNPNKYFKVYNPKVKSNKKP